MHTPLHAARVAVTLLAAAFLFATGCAGGASPARTTVTPGSSNMVSEREEKRPSETIVRIPVGSAGAAKMPALTPAQREAVADAVQNGLPVEIVSKDGGTIKTRQEGRAVGAGATAEGDKLSDAVTGTAPALALPDGGSATGGGVERDSAGSAVKLPPLPWSNPMFWLGLAALVGAGICQFYPPVKLAVGTGVPKTLAIIGVGLLAISFYPQVLLWAAGAIVIVLLWPYILEAINKQKAERAAQAEAADALVAAEEARRYKEAARALVAAVEHPTVPHEMQEVVKRAVQAESDTEDREVIQEIKIQDKIGKFSENPR